MVQVGVSPTGLSPAVVTFSTVFGYTFFSRCRWSYNPARALTRTVWASARSLATTCAIVVYFLFLRVLRCFSSPGSPTALQRCDGISSIGFPHSDIRGSRGICPSPRLFAACHVLRRLREPQASPMRPFCLSLMSFAFRPSLVSRIPDRGARTRSLFYTLYSVSSLRYQDSRHHRLGAATLLSSRSQHVNDLVFSFLRSPRQT